MVDNAFTRGLVDSLRQDNDLGAAAKIHLK